MKAIRFHVTIPRYVAGLALGKFWPRIYTSGLSCTTYEEIPDPKLLGEDWAVLATRLGGICGSDTSAIYLKASPYLSPLVSSPSTIGHENVARIAEAGKGVDGWRVGERAVVEPTLWCVLRELHQSVPTAPGVRSTSASGARGSWHPDWRSATAGTPALRASYFLAHRSQLYHLPDQVSDENALMIEPLP
jgi:threonine dehydrogenase-like Zn-dependent dehydrogenase